jgi:protein SCO1/2
MKRVLFTLILGLSAAFAVWYGFNPLFKKAAPKAPELSLASATVLTPTKPMTDFSLKATDEKNFTQYSFLGHWTILFFGYTQCPDICPRTVATITQVWQSLPAHFQDKSALNFVFVSLDPKTDTLKDLRTFLGRFNPQFIGLTGDESVIKKLSKFCSIYSWQDPNANPQGPKVIDHSGTLLLINPQGHIQALFSPPHEVPAIAKDLQTLMMPAALPVPKS